MASSNRHWPSMFKSKPCNNQQWSHDHHSSLLSNSCGRSSNNSTFSSGEERSPEPKPRWNPKPEQIRILESIFNSGMVNPPRDEIRRIRTQLQEYGQVGDANVFYWFQNRKSRSKHKQRTLQAKTTTAMAATIAATSSSSSSSDKSSPKKSNKTGSSSCGRTSSNNSSNMLNNTDQQFGNSPTSVNQCNNYFHQLLTPSPQQQQQQLIHHNISTPHEFISHEPVYFPLQHSGSSVIGNNNNYTQGGLCLNSSTHDGIMGSGGGGGGDGVHLSSPPSVGGFSSLLMGAMIDGSGDGVNEMKSRDEVDKYKYQQELSFLVSTPNTTTCTVSSSSPLVSTPSSRAMISSSLSQILGVGEASGMEVKSIVFINGMAIEVPSSPFNVKEEFGEDVVLIHASSGHPVLTNEWGVTLHPLQQGTSYYLVGSHVVASPLLDKLDNTPDLLAPEFSYQI